MFTIIIIEKITKKFVKVAVYLNRGRPKLKIARTVDVHLRVTENEFKKIARVAKQKNLTKTAAILRGIDLLELDKPKKFKNLSAFKNSDDDAKN